MIYKNLNAGTFLDASVACPNDISSLAFEIKILSRIRFDRKWTHKMGLTSSMRLILAVPTMSFKSYTSGYSMASVFATSTTSLN